MKVLPGFSFSSGWSIPVSVATMNSSAGELRANSSMPAGGEHVRVVGVHVARRHVLHHLGGAAALGMDQELGAGVLGPHVGDVRRPDSGVHVALAVPHLHPAAGHALHVRAEPHVGAEQDLGVVAVLAPDVLHHLDRVRRRAAVVGLGLDLGRGVHVHHHERARVLGLPGAQLVGGDRVGERAAGVEVGEQHRLVGRQDRGRLRHEVDAAEGDHVGLGVGRLAREAERVAHEVRHVLHLGHLVVVRQDHGVPLLRQRPDLALQRRDVLERQRCSRTGQRLGRHVSNLSRCRNEASPYDRTGLTLSLEPAAASGSRRARAPSASAPRR